MGYIRLVRDDPKPWVDDLMEKYESYRLYYKRILGGACKVINMFDRLDLTYDVSIPSMAYCKDGTDPGIFVSFFFMSHHCLTVG